MMSISRQEEIIGALWIIAAVLAFGFGYSSWGWIFTVKGALSMLSTLWVAIREIGDERGRSQ